MLSQYSQVYLVWCSFNHEIGCNNLVHSPIFLNVLHFTMNIYLYTIFSNTFLFNNGAVSLNCGGCKGLYGHGRCPSTMVGSGWVLVGKGEKKKKQSSEECCVFSLEDYKIIFFEVLYLLCHVWGACMVQTTPTKLPHGPPQHCVTERGQTMTIQFNRAIGLYYSSRIFQRTPTK